jgi:hypothetical protein
LLLQNEEYHPQDIADSASTCGKWTPHPVAWISELMLEHILQT